MSFKTGDTVIYNNKEYVIVGYADSPTGEPNYVIKTKDGSDIQEINVSERELTQPKIGSPTKTNSAAQPVITTPQKPIDFKKIATPQSDVKTTSTQSGMDIDSELVDDLNNRFNGELINTSIFEAKHEENSNEENSNQFANPNLCFTEFTVKTKTLKDILVANRLCYFFREVGTADVTKLKFGISGELSLAGLLEFAFITFHYIVNDDTFVGVTKLKSRDIQQEKKQLIKVVNKFNGNYSADKITRNKTTSRDILDLATEMLIALDYMYLISFALDEGRDPIEKLLLDDCFHLIKKILLTKTTLDVSQCHTLCHLNILPRHVLITTSDFSAACNIQHAPVLTCKTFYISNTKALYTDSSETQFIMDNVAVYGYAWFIHRYSKYKHMFKEKAKKLCKILGLSEENSITYFDAFYKVIRDFNKKYTLFRENDKLVFNVASRGNPYSENFIQLLDSRFESPHGKTITTYKLLELIGKHLNVTDFSLEKDRYMIYSKLFLNYCIDKGYLSYEKLTLKSRGIRDHDFGGSPIRCFGVAEKMNTDIEKFLGTRRETPPTEEEIIEYLLSEETEDVINKYEQYISNKTSEEKESLRLERPKRSLDTPIFQSELERYEKTYGEYYPIQKYIQKYIQLTNDKIQLLYYIICNQTYEEFETFQYKQLDNNRAFVYVLSGHSVDKGRKEVIIRNTSLLSLTEPSLNEGNMDAFSENNGRRTISQRWEMDSNKYAGTTDLFIKRGGSNLAIEGVLIVGTATEADAASCPIGFYTRKIHCPYEATLYLNGYECAKIYTGRSKEQSESKEVEFNTTLYVFGALYNAKEYTFTKASYKEYLGVLKGEINVNIGNILNGLGTLVAAAVGTNAENIKEIFEKTNIFTQDILGTTIEIENSVTKPARGVYTVISEKIRIYLTSVNTFFDEIGKDNNVDGKSDTFLTKNVVANILTEFANIFYSILCSNNYKNYKIITGSKTNINSIYADTMDEEVGSSDQSETKTLKEAKLYEESHEGGGTYSNEDLDYAVYIFPNNLGNYEAFYNYLSIKAAQEEQEEIERAKKEEGEKNALLLTDDNNDDNIEIVRINEKVEEDKDSGGNEEINDNSVINKPSSISSPRENSSRTSYLELRLRHGVNSPITTTVGGKKTKKHKKPKNKKYTKKNVKRQQARHNKTTKRKKTTKRPATKKTRRQHTNH